MAGAFQTTTQFDRFVRLPAVLALAGVSTAQLYRLMKGGAFPQSIVLGPNARGWRLSEVIAWQTARITARDTGTDAAMRAVNPNIGRGRRPKQALGTTA